MVLGRMWGIDGYFLNSLWSNIRGNFSLSSGFFLSSLFINWLISVVIDLLKLSSPLFLVNGFTPSTSSYIKIPTFQLRIWSASKGSLLFHSSGAIYPFLSSWRSSIDLAPTRGQTQIEKGINSFMSLVR